MDPITIKKGEYMITTEKSKLNLGVIHDFLTNQAYWCKNIPFDIVKTSVENSLNLGVFHNEKQIGFARVILDYATIAYLGDVFIVPSYQGRDFLSG
jgi:hypothetical protein